MPLHAPAPAVGRRALRLPTLSLIAGVAFFAMPSAHAATLVDIDFNETADFTDNFRQLFTTGGNPISVNTTDEVLQFSAVTSYIHVYDTTPSDGIAKTTFNLTQDGDPVIVTANFSVPTANSSIGIYVINAAAEATTTSYLALLNVNNSGTRDLIRFSSNANPTVSSNAGTLNTGTLGADDGVALNTMSQLTVTYGINASNQGVLTLSAGGYSDSITFAGTALSTIEIGWRLSAATGSGQFKLNDFQVSQGAAIPEPGATALLAGFVGLGTCTGLRRRPRR